MKAVYTVLCLGLLAVCRAAPLTCDKLITTVDRGVDFSGRWYMHGLSTDSCLLSSLLHTFLKPSIELDIVYQETLKSYEVTAKMKIQTVCVNETESFIFDNTSLTLSHKKEVFHLLHSNCSECIMWKTESYTKAIILYSRKTTIDPADLKEFETQTACLGLPKPRGFGTDYDFVNCKDLTEDNNLTDEEYSIFMQRLKEFTAELVECFVRYISSWTESRVYTVNWNRVSSLYKSEHPLAILTAVAAALRELKYFSKYGPNQTETAARASVWPHWSDQRLSVAEFHQ